MEFLTALLIATLSTFAGLVVGVCLGIYIAYSYEKDTGETLFDFKNKEEREN
jgi:hypothetical protein